MNETKNGVAPVPDAANDAATYTIPELGCWIHLLTKRAAMRQDPAQRAKDLAAARAYLAQMAARIDAEHGPAPQPAGDVDLRGIDEAE